MLDVLTLLAVCVGLELVVVLVLFMAWRINRDVSSLPYWIAANVLAATGMVLMAMRGHDPSRSLVFTSLLPFIAAYVLAYHGVSRHFGEVLRYRFVGSLALVSIGGLFYFTFFQSDPVARTLCLHPLLSAISFAAGLKLVRKGRQDDLAGARVVGFVYIANGVFFVFSSLLAALDSRQVVLSEAEHAALTFFEAALFAMASAIGYVVMTTERLQQDLRHAAEHDRLTGALNRDAFLGRAQRAFEKLVRDGQVVVCLIMDIDHLKEINGRYGYRTGDILLQTLARLTRQHIRSGDILGRYGGDEFCVIMTSLDGSAAAADRLRKAFAHPQVMAEDEAVFATVSIGIAESTADCTTLDRLVSLAEAGLHKAKSGGRNRMESAASQSSALFKPVPTASDRAAFPA